MNISVIRSICSILVFSTMAHLAQAQVQKSAHQTFITDTVNTVQLNLYGAYELIEWSGNAILTETAIELYNAKPTLLKHFLEVEKRYEVNYKRNSDVMVLTHNDLKRNPIKTKNGETTEIVNVRIFYPSTFRLNSETQLTRKAPLEAKIEADSSEN